MPLFIRICWIYNLCGSIRIYKNPIKVIDPYADVSLIKQIKDILT